MKNLFFSSLRLTGLTLLLFGVAYPLVITGMARIIAANGGKGKTVELEGKTIGFEVIGQSLKSARYFNSRPSAVGYNAASTGGSNKGPTNPDYLAQVEERIKEFLKENPAIKRGQVTVDLVTASGGGLDPHISPRAAEIQIPRIATARGMDESRLRQLVEALTEQPFLGIFGTEKIHVLKLNLALDNLSQSKTGGTPLNP